MCEPDDDLTAPINAHARRAMCAAEMDTIRGLLPGLTVEGLQLARLRLKAPALVAALRDAGPLAGARELLLSTVSERLAEATGVPAVYFVGCGDMLPTAPDFPPDFGGTDVR